jgi:hypothetical protein
MGCDDRKWNTRHHGKPPRALTTGLRFFCRTKANRCYLSIGSGALRVVARVNGSRSVGAHSIVRGRTITVCVAAESPLDPIVHRNYAVRVKFGFSQLRPAGDPLAGRHTPDNLRKRRGPENSR